MLYRYSLSYMCTGFTLQVQFSVERFIVAALLISHKPLQFLAYKLHMVCIVFRRWRQWHVNVLVACARELQAPTGLGHPENWRQKISLPSRNNIHPHKKLHVGCLSTSISHFLTLPITSTKVHTEYRISGKFVPTKRLPHG